jgi:hypothetical protein
MSKGWMHTYVAWVIRRHYGAPDGIIEYSHHTHTLSLPDTAARAAASDSPPPPRIVALPFDGIAICSPREVRNEKAAKGNAPDSLPPLTMHSVLTRC